MEVRLTVDGGAAAERLWSLRERLAEVAEFRGRVVDVESPPPPGTLGPVLDALSVAVAPGGVVAALAPVLLAWIRAQRGTVTVRITRPDGRSMEITASRVRDLHTRALRDQVDDILRHLAEDREDQAGPEGGRQAGGVAAL